MNEAMGMKLSRRSILMGGAGIAIGLGAVSACADAEEMQNSRAAVAYEPWRSWKSDGAEGPRGLVRSAILAANAHDTQPWRFCAGADRIDILADHARNLGAMDAMRREMHISLGCALENAVIAARAAGYAAEVRVNPGAIDAAASGAQPVASLRLAPGVHEVSPLLAAIPHRHTNRFPYDRDRKVDADVIGKLTRVAEPPDSVRLVILDDAARRQAFSEATIAATRAIIADATMIRDSDAWFRGSDAEIAAHRDGPTLEAAGLSSFTMLLARLIPVSPERSHAAWLDQTKDTQLATAAAFGLIAVRDLYDREQALAAGRLWQRLHLQATLMGLAMQPLNQLPERVDRELQQGQPAATAKVLASLTGDAAWKATFCFRLGWPTREAPASPRQGVDEVMMAAGCGA